MSFPYKCILIVGATSGIGLAFAELFVAEGRKVIASGRRQERLDAFVQKHGSTKTASIAYDISDVAGLPNFVETVTKAHPDLDCVFLNAGIQDKFDFADPDVNLEGFHNEMALNFSRFVDMTHAFLPYLKSKKPDAAIMYTNSNLAIVPATTLPAYSASKAALNAFVMCLREQLQHAKSHVRVLEIWPPPVQSELHDAHMSNGRSFGMPADEFAREAYKGLAAGKDHVIVGSIGLEEMFHDIVNKRTELFNLVTGGLRAH